jgi:hypothetical protein
MKAQPKSIFNLLTLFALLISLLGSAAAFSPAHAALPANLPIGLTAADWSQIEAFLPPTQQTYIKALNSSAAYVFTCCRKTWSQPAYLKTFNTQAGDYFGKGSIN